MKNFIFLLSIGVLFVLFSCQNSNQKVRQLKAENDQLKIQLDSIKNELEKYKFVPIVYPKSRNIRLGETYEVAFLTGIYNIEKRPEVIVYNEKTRENPDTLNYSSDFNGCTFKVKPALKGKFVYFAKMTIPTYGDTLSFPVRWEFEVR